jgi:hypothetical protein
VQDRRGIGGPGEALWISAVVTAHAVQPGTGHALARRGGIERVVTACKLAPACSGEQVVVAERK